MNIELHSQQEDLWHKMVKAAMKQFADNQSATKGNKNWYMECADYVQNRENCRLGQGNEDRIELQLDVLGFSKMDGKWTFAILVIWLFLWEAISEI